MAFDFMRALDLGRQALKLVESLGGRSSRGDSVFDLGVEPRGDGGRDDGRATDCWPRPGQGQGEAASAPTSRPTPPPAPSAGGVRHGETTQRPADGLLRDFTGVAAAEYAPVPGAVAGPGEVVWTWVPFEEMDGRGKDRPVLLVGRDGDLLLGLMLTSRDRNNAAARDDDYLDVGTGEWDRTGRASEVKLDRVLRVDPAAVRREGGQLDADRFAAVADALARRHGWRR